MATFMLELYHWVISYSDLSRPCITYNEMEDLGKILFNELLDAHGGWKSH